MAALDLTSFAPALKQLYPKGLSEILYKKCPLFGWLNKQTDFEGELWVIAPFFAGNTAANTFLDAQSQKEAISLEKFKVTRNRQYAIASVDAETIMASRSDKGAFARALDKQIRGSMYSFERGVAHQIYHDKGGARAKGDGAYTISGNVITLLDKRDIIHFERNMALQFSATDGNSGSVKPGTVKVSKVNRDSTVGTVEVFEADISAAITGAANTDYIFRKGDFGTCIPGLRSWFPATVSGSDSFYDVNRSKDRVRLAGAYWDGLGGLKEETLIDAVSELDTNGGEPSACFLNNKRMAEILKSIRTQTWIDVKTDKPGISYKGLILPTEHGDVPLIPDPNCPYDDFYLLDKNAITFRSLGEYPHFATDDGKKYQREATSDGIEFRIRGWGALGVEMPGHCLRGKW